VPAGFDVETLVAGLPFPVSFDFLPDGRVLFVEQFSATLRVVTPGSPLQAEPVLTVAAVVTGGERGLIAVAVDPSFPERPYVYLGYDVWTDHPHIRIARYTLSGNLDGEGYGDLVADPLSRFDLVADAPDATPIHNCGTLRFGPDGLLYASLGDDAAPCAAQDPGSLRGVILRMRTDLLPEGPGEAFRAQLVPADNPFADSPDSNLALVAAFGLRNPFRLQIDPALGTLALGDVGDYRREEVDLLQPPAPGLAGAAAPAGAAPLGANFGWPWLEGSLVGRFAADCGPEAQGLVAPVYEYDRAQQAGPAAFIPAGFHRPVPGAPFKWPAGHDGDLFVGEYYSGVLRRIEEADGGWAVAAPIEGQPSPTAWGTGFQQVSDWRFGPDGDLWFCRQAVDNAFGTGSIGRVVATELLGVPPRAPLPIRLVRSPAVRTAEFRLTSGSDACVRIADLAGRTLRVLRAAGPSAPGAEPMELRVTWDGTSEAGEPARPGMYLALVESGGRRAALRVPFLR
jgi:glucose/arabinose dehydrogenase